ASDPALGLVTRVTPDQIRNVEAVLNASRALAAGYTGLYRGESSTSQGPGGGAATGVGGNLAVVMGESPEPGESLVDFEPPTNTIPQLLGPGGALVPMTIPHFPARVIGWTTINQTPGDVQRRLGR